MSCFSVKFLTAKKQFTITPRAPPLTLTLKKVLTSLKSKIYYLEEYIKKLIEWAFCKDSAKVIDRDAYFLLFLSFNVLMIGSQFCNKNNFQFVCK